jgi:hypothetical protein
LGTKNKSKKRKEDMELQLIEKEGDTKMWMPKECKSSLKNGKNTSFLVRWVYGKNSVGIPD